MAKNPIKHSLIALAVLGVLLPAVPSAVAAPAAAQKYAAFADNDGGKGKSKDAEKDKDGNGGGKGNAGGNGDGGGGNGNGNGGNGNGNGNGGNGNGGKDKVPSARVRGNYVLKIAGFFAGSGEAQASGAGITIAATVMDSNGNDYALSSGHLNIVKDRFRGTGTVGGLKVEIDGRLDPQDDRSGEVLKKGRMTFTIRTAKGHFARGAGDQRETGG